MLNFAPPPFPLNPSVGDWFGNFQWNGSRWVCTAASGFRINVEAFGPQGAYPIGTPYVYQPSPGLAALMVECIGGGGTGGPTYSGFTNLIQTGGGGGAGGYSRKTLAANLVLGGVLFSVGHGGPAGGPVIYAGGATSFGGFCVAYGGQGGEGNSDQATSVGAGGAGAPVGIGDFTLAGGDGESGQLSQQVLAGAAGVQLTAQGGNGGTIWGGNRNNDVWTGLGGKGQDGVEGSGAGGSGAVSNGAPIGSFFDGGSGGAGQILITEYIFAGGDTGPPPCEPVGDCNPCPPDPCWPGWPGGRWPGGRGGWR